MAITSLTTIREGADGTTHRIKWASDLDDPLFRVYRNGHRLRVTRTDSVVISMPVEQHDVIEVFDDTTKPERTAESTVTLTWDAVAGADGYRIEEYVDSAWVYRRTIEDDGSPQYRVETDPLTDDEEHRYRVRPFGPDSNDGTALELTATLARHPDPPNVTYVFDDGTKKVTIAAA